MSVLVFTFPFHFASHLYFGGCQIYLVLHCFPQKVNPETLGVNIENQLVQKIFAEMASPQSKLDRFKCEVCDQKFANFLIKKEHLEKQHNFLVCFMPQCGKRHKSAREMQTHFLKSHSVLTARVANLSAD